MSEKAKKNSLLSTWKEIATYLNFSVRTCRRWEKKLDLPVHRIGDASKSRIFAYKDELDEWFDAKFKKKAPTPAYQFIFLRAKWQKSLYFILLTTAALFICFLFIFKPHNSQPADFKIENSSLAIFDKKGKELWRYNTGIENLVDEKTYRSNFQYRRINIRKATLPHLIIKDINQDKKKEILFSIQTQSEFGEGDLICFNHKGTRLWKFKVGCELKFGPKIYSNDYRIKGFDVCDLDNDGKSEIVVISPHKNYFPTQLIILNHQGEKIGEYWNSGRLADIAFVDLNENQRKEIIVAGCNNEYGKGCIIIFDSFYVRGSSPQSEFYKCNGLRPGSEKYYILLPRTDIDILESPVEVVVLIEILNNDRLSFRTRHSNIFYEFNYKFELQDVRHSHTFIQNHKRARREGKINSKLNEVYWNRLANGSLYYDGKNWISSPTVNLRWKNLKN